LTSLPSQLDSNKFTTTTSFQCNRIGNRIITAQRTKSHQFSLPPPKFQRIIPGKEITHRKSARQHHSRKENYTGNQHGNIIPGKERKLQTGNQHDNIIPGKEITAL
jgi:hypothetical protein